MQVQAAGYPPCTFPGCAAVFDAASAGDKDAHGGIATGWRWPEGTDDAPGTAIHDHTTGGHSLDLVDIVEADQNDPAVTAAAVTSATWECQCGARGMRTVGYREPDHTDAQHRERLLRLARTGHAEHACRVARRH